MTIFHIEFLLEFLIWYIVIMWAYAIWNAIFYPPPKEENTKPLLEWWKEKHK